MTLPEHPGRYPRRTLDRDHHRPGPHVRRDHGLFTPPFDACAARGAAVCHDPILARRWRRPQARLLYRQPFLVKVAQVAALHWLLYMHLLLQYGTCMRYASRRPGSHDRARAPVHAAGRRRIGLVINRQRKSPVKESARWRGSRWPRWTVPLVTSMPTLSRPATGLVMPPPRALTWWCSRN